MPLIQLDSSVMKNRIRSQDIKINLLLFPSQEASPILLSLYFHSHYVCIKVKDAVKKKDPANSVRDIKGRGRQGR